MIRLSLLLLMLGCCQDVLSEETHTDEQAEVNMEKMSKLRARWNKIHPVSFPPLTLDTQKFLEEYSKMNHGYQKHVKSEAEINGVFASKLIEGDIIPSDQDIANMEARLRADQTHDLHDVERSKRGTPITCATLWDRNVPIPFILDKRFTDAQKSTLRTNIQTITDNTCLTFKENGEGKKLEYLLNNDFCGSRIGDVRHQRDRFFDPESQKILLTENCIRTRQIQHETMHALGFDHTQARTDRDDYMQVDGDNIKQKYIQNFEKRDVKESATTHGIPYEYNSVLHYSAISPGFQIDDSKPSLIPRDRGYLHTVYGYRATFNDWKMINIHYKCHETCEGQFDCMNGGFRNPRDCDQCVCPQFHNGSRCEYERDVLTLSPGETMRLDRKFLPDATTIHDSVLNRDRTIPKLIKAPEGSRIIVTIHNISGGWCQEQCEENALEIVDGDLTRVGKRFCCQDSPEKFPYTFNSTTNVVGFVIFAKAGLDLTVNATFTVEGTSRTTEQPVTSLSTVISETTGSTPGSTVPHPPDQTTVEPTAKTVTDGTEETSSVITDNSSTERSTEVPTAVTVEPETTEGSGITEQTTEGSGINDEATTEPQTETADTDATTAMDLLTSESPELNEEASTDVNRIEFTTPSDMPTHTPTRESRIPSPWTNSPTDEPYPTYPAGTEKPITDSSTIQEILDSIKSLLADIREKIDHLANSIKW